MVALVQPRFSIAFISSKKGWCGESHTLPYPGYATDFMHTVGECSSQYAGYVSQRISSFFCFFLFQAAVADTLSRKKNCLENSK